MAVAPERLRGDIVRLLHRGPGLRDFTHEAARAIARAVPFDGVCLLALDPATLLPTSEVVENGLPPEVGARLAELETRGLDFNHFTVLARSERRAATLVDATEGHLDRSRRHHELRDPAGFGDELRAALVEDDATWGGLTLLRAAGSPAFTPEEVALVAALSQPLAEGVRRAVLDGTLLSGACPGQDAAAGLVLLGPDHVITHTDDVAEQWLAELPGEPVPPAVAAVASRARAIVEDRASDGAVASVRVRSGSGTWLLLRGSVLGEQTAVVIEPARPHELAPLIAIAYGLTEREREVTQLVAQGLTTNAISEQLHVSPWTVQDHLKAVFEKTGVSTRGELVARLFFEHYAPRLGSATPL